MTIVKCDVCNGEGKVEQYDPMPRLVKIWLSLDEQDQFEVLLYAKYLKAKRSRVHAHVAALAGEQK
jgi:hypothetical protein